MSTMNTVNVSSLASLANYSSYPAAYSTVTNPGAAASFFSSPYYYAAQSLLSSYAPPISYRSPSPDPLAVSPEVASKAIRRLIYFSLKEAGFDAATPAAIQRLEAEVTACSPFVFSPSLR